MTAIASYISTCVNSCLLTYNLNANKKNAVYHCLKLKITPRKVKTNLLLQCRVRNESNLEHSRLFLWYLKKLFEILIDQSVIYQRLLLI